MSGVIYTESCHAGLLCMALNLGNSFGSSLSVGVCWIKLNNQTKYVELPVECLRTRVQFPPPPPTIPPKGFNAVLVTAFFFVFMHSYSPAKVSKNPLTWFHYLIPCHHECRASQNTGCRLCRTRSGIPRMEAYRGFIGGYWLPRDRG